MRIRHINLLTLLSSAWLFSNVTALAGTPGGAVETSATPSIENLRQADLERLPQALFSPTEHVAESAAATLPAPSREAAPVGTVITDGASPQDKGEARPAKNCMRGAVSWYGPRFSGRRTANGERFDPGALTAAHQSWPFGTLVRVTHPANGQQVEVRINDRGPFHGDRILDLSREAAARIGLLAQGTATLLIEKLGGQGLGCHVGDGVPAKILKASSTPIGPASRRSGSTRYAAARHKPGIARQHISAKGQAVAACKQHCVKPRASAPMRARTTRSLVRR